MSELSALDPEPTLHTLESGLTVRILSLKTRQFFRLLRILTNGPLAFMMEAKNLFGSGDPSEFAVKLASMLLLSIPNAEEETLAFVHSMLEPAQLIKGKKLDKASQDRNQSLWEQFYEEMHNPEPEDLIAIIEKIVHNEAEDVQALGKRLAAMFKVAEKTGQLKPNSDSQTSQDTNSSEDSVELST